MRLRRGGNKHALLRSGRCWCFPCARRGSHDPGPDVLQQPLVDEVDAVLSPALEQGCQHAGGESDLAAPSQAALKPGAPAELPENANHVEISPRGGV